jgi:hypothetical protein
MTGRRASPREPVNPRWWAAIALRVVTLLFAVGAVFIHRNDFQRQWLAGPSSARWSCGRWPPGPVVRPRVDAMGLARGRRRAADLAAGARRWQYTRSDPLITTATATAAVPPAVAGAKFGRWDPRRSGGRREHEVRAAAVQPDVVRDGVLLMANGLLIGMAAHRAGDGSAAAGREGC